MRREMFRPKRSLISRKHKNFEDIVDLLSVACIVVKGIKIAYRKEIVREDLREKAQDGLDVMLDYLLTVFDAMVSRWEELNPGKEYPANGTRNLLEGLGYDIATVKTILENEEEDT
jgi:hypothetical protein